MRSSSRFWKSNVVWAILFREVLAGSLFFVDASTFVRNCELIDEIDC